MLVICFLCWFHICSWLIVSLLVNKYEAGGGYRILLCVNCFFLLTYCVYIYVSTYTHILPTHMYMCVFMYLCVWQVI